jgi:opacity protein-like surface antigen
MKRIQMAVIFATVFAVAAFAPTAGAAPVNAGTLELNAGYAKSSTEVTSTGDSWGGGITFGAAYWRPISPSVSLGGELSLDNLGNIEANYVDPVTLAAVSEEFSGKAFRINPAIRFNFGAPVGPSFFAQGGVGLYNVSFDYSYSDDQGNSSKDDASESKMGLNFGAGVAFPVGPKTKMNFQGNYHTVSTEGESMNYLQFRAGIGFGL